MLLTWALIVCALAADPPPQAGAAQLQRESAMRQMQAAIEAQRASAARQSATTRNAPLPVLAASAVEPPPQGDCDPLPEEALDPLIDAAARREGLEASLVRSVARQESGLRPCAVSRKGAMGLMQLMPDTARELGVADPFDPAQSIDGGARLLRRYLDTFGNLPFALAAYNAGPARVTETGGVPRIPETREYVQRILSVLPIEISGK